MAEKEAVDRVAESINKAVARILASTRYREWMVGEPLRKGDLVLFNNSFLYREGITARAKSDKYLGRVADSKGQPQPPTLVIRSASRINAQFKRIPARNVAQLGTVRVEDAIQDEISELGTIIFALAAQIGPDEPALVNFGFSGISALRYEPSQAEAARFHNSALSLNALDDIDALWSGVQKVLAAGGRGEDAVLAAHFEEGLADLREAAGRPISLDDVRAGAPSILADVVRRTDQQVKTYKRVLAVHLRKPQDAEALNELLRIAYNFADGAKALITLVVGISDLKPLLFWLTISDQSDLADRFSELPFALVGKAKPSLDRYRTVISAARNRAFHDLFAFGRPFRVQLTGEAFRAPELRLFREFRRGTPALEFEDRELVDLLEGFTRTPESPVPVGFWEKNLAVIESVASLTRAVQKALILIAGVRRVRAPKRSAPRRESLQRRTE